MSRVYKKIVELVLNVAAWVDDYRYVIYWQLRDWLANDTGEIFLIARQSQVTSPVLLFIPGVYESWRFMKPLITYLHERGYEIHVLDELGYNTGEVDVMAAVVDDYISSHKLKNVTIIAHSKGGLIGKYMLMHMNPNSFIRGVVALNTPFSGSRYAYLLPLQAVRLFRPNSETLVALKGGEGVNKKIVSIYGSFDPHIPYGSFLSGGVNVRLNTRGHFRIMKDKLVHQAVLKAVKKLSVD